MGEIAWARVDERQSHRQAGIDVGFLGCDPAKIVEAWQAAMLDNEVQVLERGRNVIDIGHIERIAVERNDGGALVDVDVLDPKLFAASRYL